MPKLSTLALAAAGAAALGGAAAAATKPASHVMDVALPDGAIAHVRYYGDVAPKITVSQAPGIFGPVAWAPLPMPQLGDFGQVMARIERQREALVNRVRQMSRQAGTAPGARANVVSYGDAPAGSSSVSVVSVSNGRSTCTRTTRVTSQGAGKPPKVTSDISGNCSAEGGAPARRGAAAVHRPAQALDRT